MGPFPPTTSEIPEAPGRLLRAGKTYLQPLAFLPAGAWELGRLQKQDPQVAKQLSEAGPVRWGQSLLPGQALSSIPGPKGDVSQASSSVLQASGRPPLPPREGQ